MKEQSLKSLIVQLIWGIAVNFLIGALMYTLSVPWLAIVGAVFFFCLTFGGIYALNRRIIKLLWSGWFGGCYYTFPVEENPKLWVKAKHSFKYLGVSSTTILDQFREWVESLPQNSNFEFHFLLMDPQAKALPNQEAYRRDRPSTDVEVQQECNITRHKIQTSIEALKALEVYKKGRLKIKLYDEFIPWWVYIFDEGSGYVGILERGKSSLNSPVLILKKHPKFTTIFDAFAKTWERMWENAKDV